MHSGSLEKAGTPRKRTLSRGMSEDESLRHLIKEAEGSAKRLTRAESKVAPPRKPPTGEKQAEEDLITNFPGMLDLQESYEEALQEVRGLEVQRETLSFQVDCLQDALEGAEEMLAEARREADHANEELERERQAKRRLEESADSLKEMVAALTEEIQRLKEERVTIPTVPVYSLVTDSWPDGEGHAEEKEEGAEKGAGTGKGGLRGDGRAEEEAEEAMEAVEEAGEWADASDAPLTLIRLDSMPSPQPVEPETTAGSLLAAFFRKGKEEQPPAEGGHPALRSGLLGSSVDSDDGQAEGEGPLTRGFFQKIFQNKAAADGPTGETPPEECPGQATDAPDAGPTLPQRDIPGEGGEQGGEQGGALQLPGQDGGEPRSPKSPDSCVVS